MKRPPATSISAMLIALISLSLLIASFESAQSPRPGKSELRILLVGHNPEDPYVNYAPTKKMVELHRERIGAFRDLLQRHFTSVKTVHANDYKVTMSDAADVTIFDAKPRPHRKATGEEKEWQVPLLPAEFNRPVLTIGEVSADIGNPIGLKLDWL